MTLDPAGLEAAAKALWTREGTSVLAEETWHELAESAVRAYLAASPVPPDGEPNAAEVLSLIYVMLTGAEPMWAEMPADERCARAANEAQQAILAADREAPAPDERLREAAVIEAVAWSLFPDHPRPMSEAGLDCARRAIDTALFAAADREAPDEEEVR